MKDAFYKKKIKYKQSYGKIAHIGATDIAVIWETLDVQPEELVKANLSTEVRKVEHRNEDVLEIVKLKEFWLIFHSIESVKNKMLEADTNLETSMMVCQGLGKLLALS